MRLAFRVVIEEQLLPHRLCQTQLLLMSKANRLGSWHPPGNLQGEVDYHLLISDTGNFCAFPETTYLSLIKNLLKAQVSTLPVHSNPAGRFSLCYCIDSSLLKQDCMVLLSHFSSDLVLGPSKVESHICSWLRPK